MSYREGHGRLVAVGRPLSPGVSGGGDRSILAQCSRQDSGASPWSSVTSEWWRRLGGSLGAPSDRGGGASPGHRDRGRSVPACAVAAPSACSANLDDGLAGNQSHLRAPPTTYTATRRRLESTADPLQRQSRPPAHSQCPRTSPAAGRKPRASTSRATAPPASPPHLCLHTALPSSVPQRHPPLLLAACCLLLPLLLRAFPCCSRRPTPPSIAPASAVVCSVRPTASFPP